MRISSIVFGIAFALLLTGYALISCQSSQDFLLEKMLNAVVRAPSTESFDGLKILMCGTGSPLPAPDRAQACVAVIAGDATYLVDAGEGSAKTAALNGLALNRLRAIFVTHYHSDHIAGIATFNLNSWVAGRQQPLQVIGPVGVHRVVNSINEMYALDRTYRVLHHGDALLDPALGVLASKEIELGTIWEAAGLTITAFEVDHSPIEPAVGYRFDYKGRSVVISGDTVTSNTLVAAGKNADLLLHDALSIPIMRALERAVLKVGNMRSAAILQDVQTYHAQSAKLASLVAQAGIRKLALYHFVPAPGNLLMKKIYARHLPSDAVLTEDGMWFELPANSSEIIIRK